MLLDLHCLDEDGNCEVLSFSNVNFACIPITGRVTQNSIAVNESVLKASLDNFEVREWCVPGEPGEYLSLKPVLSVHPFTDLFFVVKLQVGKLTTHKTLMQLSRLVLFKTRMILAN